MYTILILHNLILATNYFIPLWRKSSGSKSAIQLTLWSDNRRMSGYEIQTQVMTVECWYGGDNPHRIMEGFAHASNGKGLTDCRDVVALVRILLWYERLNVWSSHLQRRSHSGPTRSMIPRPFDLWSHSEQEVTVIKPPRSPTALQWPTHSLCSQRAMIELGLI